METIIQELRRRAEEERYTWRCCGQKSPPPVYPERSAPRDGVYVSLCRSGRRPFWSWYTPARQASSPLLMVSPGYRAELYAYPGTLTERYHVLAVSPLGYHTPDGPDQRLLRRGAWPVLYDTVFGGADTYEEWLLDAMTAIRWAGEAGGADTRALVFCGTSQGGGLSLVLGGLYGEQCRAVCADQPFLVGFSRERLEEVISFAAQGYRQPIVSYEKAAERLRVADPMSYAGRLDCPTLLAAGEADRECPPQWVEALYRKLPEPKEYVCFPGRQHGYCVDFYDKMVDFLEKALQ